MDKKERIFQDFIQCEFFDKHAEQNILHFVLNVNIRRGEYEGNEFILKKISCDCIVIFREFILADARIDRSDYILLSTEEFINYTCKITGKSREQLFGLANPWV